MLICGLSPASGAEITGTVKSKSGEPLADVMMVSRCRRPIVETDVGGFFKLPDPSSPDCGNVILFSLMGFRPLIKFVDATTHEVNVVLEEVAKDDREIPSCSGSGKRIGFYLRIPMQRSFRQKVLGPICRLRHAALK
jgi:hypothetical protein